MTLRVLRHRLDTALSPIQALLALRDEPGLFGLLGDWHGSRAVVGFDPVRRLGADGDPFDALAGPPAMDDGSAGNFGGGWVGYLGYRLGARLEALPDTPPQPVAVDDFSLAWHDFVLVHGPDGWWFESLADSGDLTGVLARLRQVRRLLSEPPCSRNPYDIGEFTASPGSAGHRAAVAETLERLRAGSLFQANVCRRLEAGFSGDPLDVFCAAATDLRPAYGAFLRTPWGAVASLSPELFLRRTGRHVLTSPIKGTAPLSEGADTLAGSAKDLAENTMIVDLMRNDLGRVCLPGTVRAADPPSAQRRAEVWHLVSDVTGELEPGITDADLLRATFPPGSVTGAPKVAAMRLIAELEATGREVYTGAIGYRSPSAGLELSVAIRTFEFAAGRVWLGVGGGVVIGSTPDGELEETLVKARPLLAAVDARLDGTEAAASATPADPEPVLLRAAAGQGQAPMSAGTPEPDPSAGVFTTLLVQNGSPVDLREHLARLGASVAACYRAAVPADLSDRVRSMAAGLTGRHRLRVTATPNPGGAVEVSVEAEPLLEPEPQPWRLTPVVIPDGLGEHKWEDRGRLRAAEPTPGAWGTDRDALVCDTDGALLETGRGSLFLVTDDAVLTPPLDGRILPGVTRQRAIEELSRAGIPVHQRRIDADDVADAVELLVTSSLQRVRPVASVDGLGTWAPGATTAWLSSRLQPDSEPIAAVSAARADPAYRGLRLLVVDNYDSFVYNLDQRLRFLGAAPTVVRNDAIAVEAVAEDIGAGRLHGIVISPGPGTPDEAGVSTELVRRLGARIPILGVCLGHQCIAAAYGARVVRAGEILHGRQSLVHHNGAGAYAGLDGPLLVGRYHSLVVDEATLPADLLVTARTGRGVPMGIRHRSHPVEGVQFHPESVLTPLGDQILANFLAHCARYDCTRREPQPSA